ncbi:MAG: hypothetical protein ABTQ32_21235, partial [Myxococcaceae bacterium]
MNIAVPGFAAWHETQRDCTMAFTVASAEDAERYRSADPEHIKLEATEGGAVRVRCERGARVRVSTTAGLRRR